MRFLHPYGKGSHKYRILSESEGGICLRLLFDIKLPAVAAYKTLNRATLNKLCHKAVNSAFTGHYIVAGVGFPQLSLR